MANLLSEEDFGLKIYNRFPPKYREDDLGQRLALKRYLQALSDGGFRYIIQDTNGLLDLKDPDKTSMDALYKLYEQYGLEVFHGIPENYLRSLLPYLGTAWSYKGSINIIEFVCTTLSGIKVSSQVDYVDKKAVFNEALFGEAIFGNVDSFEFPRVTIRLEMDFALSDYFPNSEQFHRILTNFLPFYCDLALVYSYVYSDENALIFREVEINHINDTNTENRNVGSVEYERNKIKYIMDDSGSIVSSVSAFEQKVKHTLTDSVGVESEDTCSSVIGTMSMLNATFGHAVLGRPKFNNTSFDYVQVSY